MIIGIFTALPLTASATEEPAILVYQYTELGNNQVEITGYTGSGGDIEIPYELNDMEVVAIGANAFVGNEDITSVKIHDFIERIGKGAFFGCSYLSSVVMGSNVESIGADAFYGTALYNDDANWTNGVLYIDSALIKALPSVTGEYSVEFGTLTIADNAFDRCSQLTKVNLPDTLKYIGEEAFLNCKGLTEVSVSDAVRVIGAHAFGYFMDGSDYIRENDFTIYFEAGSAAEQYANDNGFYNTEKTVIETINIEFDEPVYDGTPAKTAVVTTVPEGALNISEVDIAYWLMSPTGYLDDAAMLDENQTFDADMYYMPYVPDFFNKAYLVHINSGYTFNAVSTRVTVNGRVMNSDADMFTLTSDITEVNVSIPKLKYTYTGKVIKPAVTVKDSKGNKLVKGTDYTVNYPKAVNVGLYMIEVVMQGKYQGVEYTEFSIIQAKNPMAVKAAAKTVKYATVKKKNVTVTPITVKKAQGKKTFKKTSGNKKIIVNTKTGKVTVKKGLKKGTYTVKVKVTAKGTKNYKALSKTVKFKIKVK